MEPYRESVEDFLRRWRSQYEGDRVFRVLGITVVIGIRQQPRARRAAKGGHEGRRRPNRVLGRI